MKLKEVPSLVLAVVVCEIAGIVGSFFTMPSIPIWYASLIKPSFNPPSWVFGPVWTALFAMMGIALWLVLSKKPFRRRQASIAVGVFTLQLVLNVLWSYFFFGQMDPQAALIEIVVLWLAILATIIVFSRIRLSAGLLFIPYLLWVTFAAFLNYSLWQLNPPKENVPPAIQSSLPQGYSPTNYVVEKTTDIACQKSEECETPAEYMLMSRCPFTSLCIQDRCAVVCPQPSR